MCEREDAASAEISDVNGEPAVVLRTGAKAIVVLFIAGEGGQVTQIRAIATPDKLQRL